jgi:hypothetical protein
VVEAEQAADAIVDAMLEYGDPLPASDPVPSYSGNIRLRLPRSLHALLDSLAAEEGVSLNQLMVAFLAERAGFSVAERRRTPAGLVMARESDAPEYGKPAGATEPATKPASARRARTTRGKKDG